MSDARPATIQVMDRAQLRGRDNVVTFFHVRWEDYVAMDRIHSPSIRRAYLDGVLELVSPGDYHEVCKTMLARLVETYAVQRGLVVNGKGSKTLRKKLRAAGIEPDECYFLGSRPKPFPDLAIEVISTNEFIDKFELYRRLRVRELWLWRRDDLELYRLTRRGYERVKRSRVLPKLDVVDLVRRMRRADPWQQTREIRAYMRWLARH